MAYIYDLTDTWNASGTTFNGIKLNVTDSASASSSKLVTLQTNGTEHFSITKAGVGYVSGNLGVGTASPATKLHLLTASATAVAVRAANSVSYAELQVDSSGNSQLVAPGGVQIFNTNGSERMRITSGGNVGIGMTTPGAALQVNGNTRLSNGTTFPTGNSLIRSIQAMSGSANQFVSSSIDFYTATFTDNGQIAFSTGTTERMRIDGSGNVGIGTNSPASLLHVKRGSNATEVYPSGTWASRIINATDGSGENGLVVGNRWAGTGSTIFEVGSIFGGGSGSWYSYYKIDGSGNSVWSSGGTERMRLNSNGFLLVGATSPLGGNTSSEFKVTGAGSWPLTLNANDRGLLIRNSASSAGVYAYFEYNGGTNNGSISWSGGTTAYNTTSDARIKDNIVDAPDAGDLIDAIQVRSWDFKADGAHWRYGMVAQELLEVAPEAVNKPEDEEMMMGVDYSKLVPMLIKEVQSLRARVAQLEGN